MHGYISSEISGPNIAKVALTYLEDINRLSLVSLPRRGVLRQSPCGLVSGGFFYHDIYDRDAPC